MCLPGKLLKTGTYYKERRNLIQHFGIPIGVMVHSEGYSRLFHKTRHRTDTLNSYSKHCQQLYIGGKVGKAQKQSALLG